MLKQVKSQNLSRIGVCIVLILVAALGFSGYYYYTAEKEETKHLAYDQISAIAALKTNEISRWRAERLADAHIIMHTPFIALLVQQYFRRPDESPSVQQVLNWMSTYRDHFDYSSVSLLDADGNMRFSLPGGEQSDDHLRRLVSQAMHSKEPIFGDLDRSETVTGIHLDLVVPLFSDEETDGAAVGAVLIRINPNPFLYRLIQSWPTPSPTAESLLVRSEGNEVVYLNELRHRKNTALSLRIPISDLKAPCAMAGRGEEGVLDGVDYRGSSVLSVIKRIPDTPWFLVSKIDAEEVYAPVREEAWLAIVVASLLLAGAGMALLLLWSHQRSKLIREAHDGLERRVEQRTADLLATNERLNQEMRLRTQAEKECRSVTARLAETEESERRRVARELHDRVGQNLTALNFSITTVMNQLPPGSPPGVVSRLGDSLHLLSNTMSCVRDVMADLRPVLLDDHGLAAVLHWYGREFSERSGIPTAVECGDQIPRLGLSEEIALFRIAQEALTNVMRHARASQVTLELEATNGTIRMTIRDNGVGFVPETAILARTERSGLGMLSMRERAEMIGGRFRVSSAPGGGTRIVVEVARKENGSKVPGSKVQG